MVTFDLWTVPVTIGRDSMTAGKPQPFLVSDSFEVYARRGWYIAGVTFTIELEREEDGRWIAEVTALPGVLCYGKDRDEVVAGVQALALRVIAERLESREEPAEFLNVTFQAA